MLTAYENYRVAHQALFSAPDANRFSEVSKTVVEEYLENRLIWDELNFYKSNGHILGKHPIFEELLSFEALRKLNSAELSRKRQNLYINIQKTRKLLDSGKKPSLNLQRLESIQTKERMLVEIDTLLRSR
ncbi:MAG: hypothetical protein NTU44_04650 [Bacteroidetes bacterium]|nr:hypothetical protein [Bacteroidota bacterium]